MEEIDISTVGKKSARGILALISRTFILNILSYGVSLVIFTVLAPRDFGVYTVAIAGQRIISFFTDFGLGAALIQKREQLTSDDLRTAFTLQAGITLIIFVFVFILQGIIASFFRLGEEAATLFIVLVFLIFLSSFKTIPSILLERTINFQKLIIPQIAEVLIFNLILVVLVLKGNGINSYSWAFLVSGIAGIPFYYFVSPWEIGIGIKKESMKHLRYGLQFQAKNVLATVKDDFLTVFLAKVLSFTELGYIGFGQRNAFFAYRTIVDNITKVTFSAYSRIQHDMAFLKRAIEKSLFFVSSIMFPLLTGIIITAPYIIDFVPKWHNKWEPAIVSLMFFCLNALVSSLSGIFVNVLDATGRVKTTLKLMALWTLLTWILTPILIVVYGYNGVSIASFLVTLTIGITVVLVKRIVEFDFLGSIYKPLFSTIIMDVFVFAGAKLLVHNIISLILIIGLGGLLYLGIMYLLAMNELKSGFSIVLAKNEK